VKQQPEEPTCRRHIKKIFVLCDLQELYVAFHQICPNVQLNFPNLHNSVQNTAFVQVQEGPIQYVSV
jgi:hypothetical protein